MEQLESSEEYYTAIHEAGHAVACVILKRAFYNVSIKHSKHYAGYCHLSVNGTTKSSKTEKQRFFRRERAVMIGLSGALSEKIITNRQGEDLWGSYKDLEDISWIMKENPILNETERNDFIQSVSTKAESMISQPVVQQQIIAVANELILRKSLSHIQVRKIMNNTGRNGYCYN